MKKKLDEILEQMKAMWASLKQAMGPAQ